jgi:hypothetical protein
MVVDGGSVYANLLFKSGEKLARIAPLTSRRTVFFILLLAALGPRHAPSPPECALFFIGIICSSQ